MAVNPKLVLLLSSVGAAVAFAGMSYQERKRRRFESVEKEMNGFLEKIGEKSKPSEQLRDKSKSV